MRKYMHIVLAALAVLLTFPMLARADAPQAFYLGSVTNGQYADASLASVSAECLAVYGAGHAASGAPVYQSTMQANGLLTGWSTCGHWVNGAWQTVNNGIRVSGVWLCANKSQPNTTKPLNEQCAPPEVNCPIGTRKINAGLPSVRCVPTTYCQGYNHYQDACDGQGMGTARDAVFIAPYATCVFSGTKSITINCDQAHGEGDEDGEGDDEGDKNNKNCAPSEVLIGYNGDGSARCKPRLDAHDPCPAGTHNIAVMPNVNCTTNTPEDTHTKDTTSTTTNTTTNPDGSTKNTTTTTNIKNDGSTTTTTTTTIINESTGKKDVEVVTVCKNSSGAVVRCGVPDGDKKGDGDGDGDGDDKDGVTGISGDLYQKKDKTFSQVYEAFRNKIEAAPAITAASEFLSVSPGGGGCPQWTVEVSFLQTSIDVGQYFCTSTASAAFTVLGIGVLIGAAFVAFRWAFL